MDSARPAAGTVVVQDGRISFVGSAGEEIPDSDRQGEVYDLSGRVMLPGFVDAHIHFSQLVWELSLLDLSAAEDIGRLRERLSWGLKESRYGEWLIGRRIRGSIFYEAKERRGRILEDITAGAPVILGSEDTHTALVNMRGAGLLREGGVFEGVPDAMVERCGDAVILWETAAFRAWWWLEEKEKRCEEPAFEEAIEALHARGVTGIYTFERLKYSRSIGASEACRRGLITTAGFYEEELVEILAAGPDAMGEDVRRGGLKLFVDGTLGSRTALLLEPYENEETRGLEVTPADRLRELALEAARNGIGLCLHAIGDGAVRVALDLLETAPGQAGRDRTGNRIEHVQLIHPDDLERFGELGVTASVQPAHLLYDWKNAEVFWGTRCQRSYPLQSLIDSGAKMAFGSDAPAVPVDPVTAIKVAATRRLHLDGQDTKEWVPREKMSVGDSLSTHTRGSALASGMEGETGIIREGYRADMVILSTDPFGSDEDLLRTEVVATIAGGELTFGADMLERKDSESGIS